MNYTESILKMVEIIMKKLLELDRTGVKGLSSAQSLNLSDLLVLMELQKNEKMTTQDLHKNFKLDRGIINTIVARLMTHGFVNKEKAQLDKRKAYLSLSETGKLVLERFTASENEALNFVFKDFSINEQKAVLKFLSRVNQLTVDKYSEESEAGDSSEGVLASS